MKPQSVGTIIGRFQTPELHEGHLHLFDHVKRKHEKVLVLMGCSPAQNSDKNPLDFESRRRLYKPDWEFYSLSLVLECKALRKVSRVTLDRLHKGDRNFVPFLDSLFVYRLIQL